MREASGYVVRIEEIVGDPVPGDGQIESNFTWDGADEARALKKRLSLMQKELRLLKKEVRADIREINASFVSQRTDVHAGFVASMFGRKAAAKDRVQKRERSKREQQQMAAGHERVASLIDELLLQIDRSAHQVDTTIAQAGPVPRAAQPKAADPVEQMRKLRSLLEEGLITPDEYESKKAELLSRM